MTSREEFLLKMYDQMHNDINRHILVIWQSVGVFVGALATFALVEKKVLSIDIAVSITLLLNAWLLAHLFDASYWYNRNLVIIANIERQFLKRSDLRYIHYYFGKHRIKNNMIEHLRIQLALGSSLAGIVLLHHFIERIIPFLYANFYKFEPICLAPYILLILIIPYLYKLKKDTNDKYSEFVRNSPGIDINTIGIIYGKGHGHPLNK